jgi:hypothetical protein
LLLVPEPGKSCFLLLDPTVKAADAGGCLSPYPLVLFGVDAVELLPYLVG